MGVFRYNLDMAGLHWRFDAPMELSITDAFKPFLEEETAADCTYSFAVGRPPEGGEILMQERPRAWRIGKRTYVERLPVLASSPCACICIDADDPLHVQGWIYPGREGYFRALDHLLDAACIEYMLSAAGAINLHSSFISDGGRGILFSAPSGTGKSTQAGLWEKYAGADQFNGDRSIIRLADGVWRAYGFPFAGSSGIYRNESAPLRAIVVLRQAPENTIERLGPGEAFRLLYSESAIMRWHDAGHTKTIDQLIRLTRDVPVYRLWCTPDERAVRLLQETLSTEEPK